MSEPMSWGTLKAKAGRTAAITLGLLELSRGDYRQFVRLVSDGVDVAAEMLAENPELHCGLNENQLTIQLVNSLRSMSFLAIHEAKIGGHCDISVEYDFGFRWLGEAKIAGSNSWLLKGFKQLVTRYSTGNPNQNAGGLIIYSFRARIDRTMDSWASYLAENFKRIVISVCDRNPLIRCSSHFHHRTGIEFRVRHVPISLHFRPEA